MVLAVAAVAATTTLITQRFDHLRALGGIVGTSVSALFLFAIAAANLVVLRAVWRTWCHVRAGGRYTDEDFDLLLDSRGLLARLFRPVFRLVTRPWHMAPLGFLFGLGFDTATEVSLLGLSATQAAQGAYRWAFIKPMRKLY